MIGYKKKEVPEHKRIGRVISHLLLCHSPNRSYWAGGIMLKFKFDTGNSLKAFDSVCVCGKETGALNKAVKFLCKYLVRESGSELVLGIGPQWCGYNFAVKR